MLFKW